MIENGVIGIIIDNLCKKNVIYYNNFIYNGNETDNENAFDIGSNYWFKDQGQTGIGNYWSDYKNKYPNAKDENEDGKWDTPYGILYFPNINKDEYPLMEQVDIYSIEI